MENYTTLKKKEGSYEFYGEEPEKINNIVVLEEYKKVKNFIEHSEDQVLFVSGKAGTGKSMLIKYIDAVFNKSKLNYIKVAPTGVASINISGQTVHSMFGLPISIITRRNIKLRGDKAKILKKVELLIIDEVSMLRADTMDAINWTMQEAKLNNKPFGGVKIVIVGDLYQLLPVLREEEKDLFFQECGYKSELFFHAKSFQNISLRYLELTKIQRQKDLEYITALNGIRVNEKTRDNLGYINRNCYGLKGEKAKIKRDITLTTTNYISEHINEAALNKIKAPKTTYKAKKTGTFKTKMPTPENLDLKVGAQVMFTRNSELGLWVNGTLGEVVSLEKKFIKVKLKESGIIHTVERAKWENTKYSIEGGKIKQHVIGTFEQFPLMLAWAITIHKSQGMTVDNVKIDLGQKSAFAVGQVYVALSRCRTVEGISLNRPISLNEIQVNNYVKDFYKSMENLKI